MRLIVKSPLTLPGCASCPSAVVLPHANEGTPRVYTPKEYELRFGTNPDPESVSRWVEIPELGVGASVKYLDDQSKDPDSGIELVM